MLAVTAPLACRGVGDVQRVFGGTQKINDIKSLEIPPVLKGKM